MATDPQLVPYEPGLVDSATNSMAEGLLGLGLYKNNPYRAYRMAENLSGLMDFVPFLGDAKGGAETVDAAAEGNYGEAAVLGLLTALGAIPGAGDVAAGALKSMFLTPSRVATFKHTLGDADDLEQAKRMDDVETPAAEIWDLTGWFKGADNKWRTELSDNESRWTDSAYDLLNETWDEQGTEDFTRQITELLEHDKLYETLPHLGLIDLSIRDLPPFQGGHYEEGVDSLFNIPDLLDRSPDAMYHVPTVVVDRQGLDISGFNPDRPRAIALHEIQHAIQDLQGLNRGANEGSIRYQASDAVEAERDALRRNPSILDPVDSLLQRETSLNLLSPYKSYRLSAGEQEASLTERMMRLGDMERYKAGLPASRTGVDPYFMQHVYGMSRDNKGVLDALENTGERFENLDPTGLLEGLKPEEAMFDYLRGYKPYDDEF